MKKLTVIIMFLITSVPLIYGAAASRRPVVDLRVEPKYFSPNEDSFQDCTFFLPLLYADKEISRWRIVIENERGKTVQRLHGESFNALVKWDGRDKKDRLVPEGLYRTRLTVWGRHLKITSPEVNVYVDNTPPFAVLSVSSTFYALTATGENKLVFTPKIEDKSPLHNWEFRISDENDRTVFITESSNTVESIEWDGVDRDTGILAPRGKYRCSFQTVDSAGNRNLPAFVDIEINVSAQDLLQRVLRYTPIYETDLGLVVQIPFEKVFLMKKGKVSYQKDAEEYLREAAIIANAYPDVPIQITGYARQLKSWEADRNLSSKLAWDVYSYLVKRGKVVGSRLKVNGRGRSPTFSRRQYDNPPHFVVLKNGVEIILEGNRDWSQ